MCLQRTDVWRPLFLCLVWCAEPKNIEMWGKRSCPANREDWGIFFLMDFSCLSHKLDQMLIKEKLNLLQINHIFHFSSQKDKKMLGLQKQTQQWEKERIWQDIKHGSFFACLVLCYKLLFQRKRVFPSTDGRAMISLARPADSSAAGGETDQLPDLRAITQRHTCRGKRTVLKNRERNRMNRGGVWWGGGLVSAADP